MAGDTFDKLAGKVRPGTYLNFESVRPPSLGTSQRGTVLIPLINHSWGPAGEFITLNLDAPDASFAKLGYSVYDDTNAAMLLIREAFKAASVVIVYILKAGTKASKVSGDLTGTAKYGGTRGNALRFSVVANPVSGFDVTVYLDTQVVGLYEGLTTITELAAASTEFITFTGTGNLAAVASVTLENGADGVAANGDITAFLDASEGQKWNTMAFPINSADGSAATLFTALKTKIRYLRDSVGKYRQAVVAGFDSDTEGIINVTNSVVLTDGTALTHAQATAFVAGITAAASNTQSNTYKPYDGAVDIVDPKNHAESVAAIQNGEFFFSFSEEGKVVVEYDINSLVTIPDGKDETYRKNRVIRVFDTFGEICMKTFPPNKFDNSPAGWEIMEGLGRTLLKEFEDAGAIKNVDYTADFLVDRSSSSGDQTFFIIGLEAVDSSEKLFFTVRTR